MRLILNAGFGNLIGAADLSLIRSLGFTGCRQDIPEGATADHIEALVREQTSAGMDSLYICRDAIGGRRVATSTALAGQPGAIEWGNEDGRSSKAYQRWLAECVGALRDLPVRPSQFTAGIVTPDRKRLGWLEEVYAIGVPAEVNCAIHTYRQEKAPWQAHPGFKSRAEEYGAVRKIIGPRRRLIVSEIGWHTAGHTEHYGFFGLRSRTVKYTDAEVAKYAVEECRIAAANGVESLTWFQLNDGPDPSYYENCFGIRRLDGSLKPVAAALKGVSGGDA